MPSVPLVCLLVVVSCDLELSMPFFLLVYFITIEWILRTHGHKSYRTNCYPTENNTAPQTTGKVTLNKRTWSGALWFTVGTQFSPIRQHRGGMLLKEIGKQLAMVCGSRLNQSFCSVFFFHRRCSLFSVNVFALSATGSAQKSILLIHQKHWTTCSISGTRWMNEWASTHAYYIQYCSVVTMRWDRFDSGVEYKRLEKKECPSIGNWIWTIKNDSIVLVLCLHSAFIWNANANDWLVTVLYTRKSEVFFQIPPPFLYLSIVPATRATFSRYVHSPQLKTLVLTITSFILYAD